MQDNISDQPCRTNSPWNRGKLIGPKPPRKAKEIWSIRVSLQVAQRVRDLALFNPALDSKLRASDLVAPRGDDVALNGRVRSRGAIMQQAADQQAASEPPPLTRVRSGPKAQAATRQTTGVGQEETFLVSCANVWKAAPCDIIGCPRSFAAMTLLDVRLNERA
jgi:hypothetical protein